MSNSEDEHDPVRNSLDPSPPPELAENNRAAPHIAGPGQTRQAGRSRSGELGPVSTLLIGVVGLGVWAGVVSLVVAIFNEDFRASLFQSWYWWVLAWVIALVAFGVVTRIESHLRERMASKWWRHAGIAFAIVPVIVISMTALVYFAAHLQAFLLEITFMVIASLLPAASYYLFLKTRRPSIFNEYVTSLSRLGLLRVLNKEESLQARRARVDSYFQRFEAVLGPLTFDSPTGGEPIQRSQFAIILTRAVDKVLPSNEDLPAADVSVADILRANVVIPLGLVTILTTLGWILVLQPEWRIVASLAVAAQGTDATQQVPVLVRLTPNLTPVTLAFLGAYFFGIQMLFRRFVRRDLGPNAYMAFTNRIILSVIAVWIAVLCYHFLSTLGADPPASGVQQGIVQMFQAPIDEGIDWPVQILVVGFVIGVFPRLLWQFIGALFSKILFLDNVLPALEAKQPLSELDGLTVWHEARLEEEGVENVPNMATVDVVDTILNTQIPPERLLTWIDQSILYSCLGPKAAGDDADSLKCKLRGLGIRTATQLAVVHRYSTEGRSALELAISKDVLTPLVEALALEPNFELAWAWRLPQYRSSE